MQETLNVTMLGHFSLGYGDKLLDESSNRMHKVWLLMACLIYSRNARLTQEKYLSVVQGADNSEVLDPAGRLKALFYRARTLLNQLWPEAGHDLIQRKNGTYGWNTAFPITLDVEEFDALCARAEKCGDEGEQLSLYRQALALYQGDFLPRLSMEPWVMPISAYFHQRYLTAADNALNLLAKQKLWTEGAALCGQALKIEPYSESLYRHLMVCRMGLGDREGAIAAYETMSELLFDTFGVMPSEESRVLYQQASRLTRDNAVTIDYVGAQLREEEGANGAILCPYDFFRFLYRFQARTIARSGEDIHMALLTLHGRDGMPLPRRNLDKIADNLQAVLLNNLRRGDAICKCSLSQFAILLPGANLENSGAVCQRLIRVFTRQYPHSPAQIHYSVQPLEPNT